MRIFVASILLLAGGVGCEALMWEGMTDVNTQSWQQWNLMHQEVAKDEILITCIDADCPQRAHLRSAHLDSGSAHTGFATYHDVQSDSPCKLSKAQLEELRKLCRELPPSTVQPNQDGEFRISAWIDGQLRTFRYNQMQLPLPARQINDLIMAAATTPGKDGPPKSVGP